jgi:hypothetical protein
MADDKPWGDVPWSGVGVAVAAAFAFLFKRTKSASSEDLRARVETAERELLSQKREIEQAVTDLTRIDKKLVAMERRMDASDITNEAIRREMINEVTEFRTQVNNAMLRLTRALSPQPKQDLGQQAG